MEKRLHDFLPELKDYYTVTSDGEFFSDNSGKMKTRDRGMENLQVNHKDGNKRNNKLENLEWCTASENQIHAFKTGLSHARKGENSNFHKLTEKDVKKVFELRKKGLTQQEIGDIVGCTKSNISCILKGKSWK